MIRRLLGRPEVAVILSLAAQAGSAMVLALVSARWLGPSDRGIVVISTVLGSLLMLVGSLGTPTGGRVLVAREDGERMSVGDVIASTRVLLVAHVATAAVVGALVFFLVEGRLSGGVLALFVVYAVLMLAAYIRRELLHGLGLHRQAVNGEVVTALCQLALTVAAYAAGILNVWTSMVALIVGVAVQVGRQHALMREHRGGSGAQRRRLIAFSAPALGTTVGQAFTLRGDRLILGAMIGSAAAGIYGSAASLSEALTLVGAGVGQVLFRRSTSGASRQSILKPMMGIAALTALGAMVLIVAAPWVVGVALGDAYASAVTPLRLLCLATVPLAAYQVAVAGLNGSGRLGAASRVTLSGAVVLILACVVLVPLAGTNGAAWASCGAYCVMAAGAFFSLPKAVR